MDEKLNLRLDGTTKLKVDTKLVEVPQNFKDKKMVDLDKLVTSIPSGSRVVFYKYDDEIQKKDSFGDSETIMLLPTFELQITNEKYGYEATFNGQDYLTDGQRDLALAAVKEKIMYCWEEIKL